MISSAAEYEFVTGIQDGEIVIDGDILPVRETYEDPEGIKQPRCLRGEDIAFLAEAANERNGVISGQQEVTVFDKRVSAAQLRTICTNLHRHLKSPGNSSDPCYFKKEYIFGEIENDVSFLPVFEYFSEAEELSPHRLYPGGILLEKSASPNNFQADGELHLEDLRKMFTDAKRQRRMYDGSFQAFSPNYSRPPSGLSSTFNVQGGDPYPYDFDNSLILFSRDYSLRYDETYTLSSFNLDVITGWRAQMLSSMTVLVTVGGYYNAHYGTDFKVQKRLAMPLAATFADGKWVLTLGEVSKAVDKMKDKLPSGSSGEYVKHVLLVSFAPIITLGDHTDF